MLLRFFLILATASLLSACVDDFFGREAGVKGAKGDTPVRYVVCGLGEKGCFVAARFNYLDSCESHKKWSEMLCETTPGTMSCRVDSSVPIAQSYCAP